MVATVGSIQIALEADLQKLVADFNKGARATENFGARTERSARSAQASWAGLFNGLAGDMRGFVGRMGALGTVMSRLGPAGLAVGAAFGAGSIGLLAFDRRAKDALATLGKLNDQAQSAGLSTDAFQGLQFKALESGVSPEKFAEAMARFAVNSEAARRGTGELYEALRNVSAVIATDFRRATDQADRFRLVLEAASRLTTASGQADFAGAAFGKRGGLEMLRLLSDVNANGGFEGVIDGARKAGAVIDAELIRRAEKLGDEIDAASRVVSINLSSAFATLAQSWGIGRLEKFAADFSVSLRRNIELAANGRSPAALSSDVLDRQIARVQAFQRTTSAAITAASDPKDVLRLAGALENARKRLAELQSARVQKAFPELAEAMKRGPQGDQFAGFRDRIEPEPTRITVKPKDAELEAKIERDRLRERVGALGGLAGKMETVRLKQLELNDATKNGAISQAEANRIVEAAKLALDAQTLAFRERAGVATDAERIAVRERELDEAVRAGTISVQERARALALYRRELEEASKFEPLKLSDTPALTRLAIEAGDLRAQLDEGLAGALRGVGGELWQLAKGGQSAADTLRNLADRFGQAAFEALAMRAIVGPLSNILGGGITALTGGGGAGLFAGPSSAAVRFHAGGKVGSGGQPIRVPAGLFAGAPRFHSGLNSSEFPSILKRGERVLTEAQEARTAATIAGLSTMAGAGGGVQINVNVKNENGSSIDVQRRQNANGGFDIDIVVKNIVRDGLAKGEFQQALNSQARAPRRIGRYG